MGDRLTWTRTGAMEQAQGDEYAISFRGEVSKIYEAEKKAEFLGSHMDWW